MKETILFVGILFQLLILSSAQSNGLIVDLIHKDSPLSPFYNSSLTHSDILINAALDSISRVESFSLNTEDYTDHTLIFPIKGTYIISFFIGTIPRASLAILDTGSDLTWIQCAPCSHCYNQGLPLFDPSKSRTFHSIACSNSLCKKVRTISCGNVGECVYNIKYGGGTTSHGIVATETITFNNTYSGQLLKYTNTIIGCGYNNTGHMKPETAGVFGLGGGPSSFISQHGDEFGKRKFSYCLLPFYFQHVTSRLKFGVDTQKSRSGEVITTPLALRNTASNYHHLSLEDVYVDGYTTRSHEISTIGNIIIDSGTTATFIRRSWYLKIEAAIIREIGHPGFSLQPFRLCYKTGTVNNFPTISLKFFASIHTLRLDTSNVFIILEDHTCLSILPTDKLQVLGNLLQVGFNVEYDLEDGTVSFAKANCLKE
ncbi:hypothetical protein Lal_00018260 [Lupinus albus]|uniref:Putative nepenthesin n=1 Tax=Lupinus albus TaxID=3870 RepID=A0A6A5LWT3_LUPAL|nr:putative nepenthesin [Lupinus albus]KAF1866874.1 hypothetical protein Lal_00018260 [Lupinus albus]